MSYTLFIAEKPDLARSIAQALSPNHTEKKGYIIGQNGKHIYTWAYGHLLELAPPEAYDPALAEWRLETLPIIPQNFKLAPIKGSGKSSQLKIIKELSQKATSLVNAGDSGREGQVIISLITSYLKINHMPTKRLWTSSLTPEAIQKAYQNMKDDKHYKNLLFAGLVRQRADWIVGLNSTRGFTVKIGEKLTLGRVQTPSLAMIYDRCQEYENFQKTKYYPIKATFQHGKEVYTGYWDGDKILDQTKANSIAQRVNNQQGLIKEFQKKNEKKYSPLLYNLSLLQKEANQKYPLTAKEVLDIAQSLYEKHKCITYPRTSSNYVTEEEVPLMHESLKSFENSPYCAFVKQADSSLVSVNNKRICQPGKVTDHHAILPTNKIPANLNKNEQLIYDLVVKRFLAQFYPAAEFEKYVILTEVVEEIFKTNVSLLLSPGWKVLYMDDKEKDNDDDEAIDKPINLNQQQPVICTDSLVQEKETAPQPLYTDGTLIDAMTKAGKKIEDAELKQALGSNGIGTEATRAQIISKLESTEYITRKGKSILITDKGKFLIETVRKTKIKSLTSVEYTAEWEKRLAMIENGIFSSTEFLEKVKQYTVSIIKEVSSLEINYEKKIESIGECPACKSGQIINGKVAYGCSRWKEGCSFKIWKKQFNKTLSEKQPIMLITKGETSVLQFTSKEKGTKYKARLVFNDNFEIKLQFANTK